MLRRRKTTTVARQPLARGGVSLAAVLTGIVVALGAMVLLSAAAAAVLASFHFRTDTLGSGATARAAVAIVVALAGLQLIAYTWGGYTAGRMARGAGVLNGFLVAFGALVVGALAVGAGYLLDASTRMNVAFSTGRVNVSHTRIVQLGTALAIASGAAMFVGAMIGGGLGSRWHTKLEQRTVGDTTIDLRDSERELELERERTRTGARDISAETPTVNA